MHKIVFYCWKNDKKHQNSDRGGSDVLLGEEGKQLGVLPVLGGQACKQQQQQ